ncbi:ceramide kinase-like [Malus sylvestris]|uniref:ceramide kinase-like n=1 Tax=Malus sylvestris TaxID=3752 RepID=UPI0021AD289A|nr:ceramide kinase-like [Malus sylvestris]
MAGAGSIPGVGEFTQMPEKRQIPPPATKPTSGFLKFHLKVLPFSRPSTSISIRAIQTSLNGTRCIPHARLDSGAVASALSCSLTLDRAGEVLLSFNSDGLSWKSLEPFDNDVSTCLGITFTSKVATEIQFSDVYSVELISHGLIHGPKVSNARKCLSGRHEYEVQVYRFTVHGFQQSKALPSLLVLAAYTFGHKDLQTCQMWVEQINASVALEQGRPKNLLVIVIQRSGHAYDMMASVGNKELASYDGVVVV